MLKTLLLFGVLAAPLLAAPAVNAVVNGASFSGGPIASGTIVSIFGTGLARTTVSAPGLPLPTTLDGTVVTINSQAIPLFFVSPTQINAQIPFRLQAGSAQLS